MAVFVAVATKLIKKLKKVIKKFNLLMVWFCYLLLYLKKTKQLNLCQVALFNLVSSYSAFGFLACGESSTLTPQSDSFFGFEPKLAFNNAILCFSAVTISGMFLSRST